MTTNSSSLHRPMTASNGTLLRRRLVKAPVSSAAHLRTETAFGPPDAADGHQNQVGAPWRDRQQALFDFGAAEKLGQFVEGRGGFQAYRCACAACGFPPGTGKPSTGAACGSARCSLRCCSLRPSAKRRHRAAAGEPAISRKRVQRPRDAGTRVAVGLRQGVENLLQCARRCRRGLPAGGSGIARPCRDSRAAGLRRLALLSARPAGCRLRHSPRQSPRYWRYGAVV